MQPGESPPTDDDADQDKEDTAGGAPHSTNDPADDDQSPAEDQSEGTRPDTTSEPEHLDEESNVGADREEKESLADEEHEFVSGPKSEEVSESAPEMPSDTVSELDSESVSEPNSESASEPNSESGFNRPAAPAPEPGATAGATAGSSAEGGFVHRFFNDQQGPLMWIREFLSSAAVVLAIGLLLFGISGVWPPMVAVESGSMEPNMEKGDLIFVTDPGRFAPDAATNDIGVVTAEDARNADYQTFGSDGSVVVFDEPGSVGSPIIHRVHLYVEEGENWFERADGNHIQAGNCEELRNCPAPDSGFITKGDNNPRYDQAQGIAPIVQEEWITGVARLRIPYLGWIRLLATGQAFLAGGLSGAIGSVTGIAGTGHGTSLLVAGVSAAGVGRATRRAS